MQKIKAIFSYFKYLLVAKNAHGVHSPFVYDLVTNVIYSSKNYYAYTPIQKVREQLENSEIRLDFIDLGAGSHYPTKSQRKVSEIAKNSAKNKKLGELLFRLVNKFQPTTILELGTSLGISGLYLSCGRRNARFISIESNEEVASIALKSMEKFQLNNASIVIGSFENKLSDAIEELKQLDFVFFDGNHQREPTLAYFQKCLKNSNKDSVFVFDDIHWSTEMEKAWETIKNHPQVTVTIDLFFIGIVFFRTNQAKEHFVIRF
ncbi:MAG: class I SAM-dependent methyltransferase [Bacteroidia bacterium]|nr:class I SAM-dependent methyltransferase [Bacteroidota bacterium]MBP6413026.1 class I SAM-dependent methyltransferase [Bacteroidia bacterium]